MRKQPSLTLGALVGGLTSLPVMALLYLGEQFAGLPFVPFDLFDWLARVLPGDIITLAIDSIVRLIRTLNLGPISELAKLIEQLLALGIFIAIGFVFGAVIAWAIRRIDGPPWQAGAWTGLVLLLLVAGIELYLGLGTNIMVAAAWLALVLVGWGALVGRSLVLHILEPIGLLTPTGGHNEGITIPVVARHFQHYLARPACFATDVGQHQKAAPQQPAQPQSIQPDGRPRRQAQQAARWRFSYCTLSH